MIKNRAIFKKIEGTLLVIRYELVNFSLVKNELHLYRYASIEISLKIKKNNQMERNKTTIILLILFRLIIIITKLIYVFAISA